ncbi:hypothetical protein PILCRDRAFT_17480 [Piloderma croceum F 1598]|uniref:Replication factor A protein 3 n=1 Tax=Piloderma croceum (strain F 1598) TaxID=765440 RepID=A0A0C3B193_PILCF|nr:hypothetical protein PILCRDRAFT_17480 [Piloderma croceum F 1598]
MSDNLSTRVNSHRLPNFIGRVVRLVGKTLKIEGKIATLEASDQGQVKVVLPEGQSLKGTFNEILGRVIDDTTIELMVGIDLGSNLDMQLVDDMVELTFKRRFKNMFS